MRFNIFIFILTLLLHSQRHLGYAYPPNHADEPPAVGDTGGGGTSSAVANNNKNNNDGNVNGDLKPLRNSETIRPQTTYVTKSSSSSSSSTAAAAVEKEERKAISSSSTNKMTTPMQAAFAYEAAVPTHVESTATATGNNASNDEHDDESSKKIIGSSVVTSVSVILNGNETEFMDSLGHKVSKPSPSLQVASPINLLNPDRYEFYTFDDNGELVKRLMTMQEIQSIVANGDGEGPSMIHTPPIEDRNPEKNVQDIVDSVQNVLNHEVEKNSTTASDKKPPVLDTPDVSSSWSLILPAIFGNTGGDIFPQQKPQQVVMTPDSELVETSTKKTGSTQTTKKSRPNKRKPSGQKRKPTTSTTPSTTRVTSKISEMVPQVVQEELEPHESVYTGMQQYQNIASNMHNFEEFSQIHIQPIYNQKPETLEVLEASTRRVFVNNYEVIQTENDAKLKNTNSSAAADTNGELNASLAKRPNDVRHKYPPLAHRHKTPNSGAGATKRPNGGGVHKQKIKKKPTTTTTTSTAAPMTTTTPAPETTTTTTNAPETTTTTSSTPIEPTTSTPIHHGWHETTKTPHGSGGHKQKLKKKPTTPTPIISTSTEQPTTTNIPETTIPQTTTEMQPSMTTTEEPTVATTPKKKKKKPSRKPGYHISSANDEGNGGGHGSGNENGNDGTNVGGNGSHNDGGSGSGNGGIHGTHPKPHLSAEKRKPTTKAPAVHHKTKPNSSKPHQQTDLTAASTIQHNSAQKHHQTTHKKHRPRPSKPTTTTTATTTSPTTIVAEPIAMTTPSSSSTTDQGSLIVEEFPGLVPLKITPNQSSITPPKSGGQSSVQKPNLQTSEDLEAIQSFDQIMQSLKDGGNTKEALSSKVATTMSPMTTSFDGSTLATSIAVNLERVTASPFTVDMAPTLNGTEEFSSSTPIVLITARPQFYMNTNIENEESSQTDEPEVVAASTLKTFNNDEDQMIQQIVLEDHVVKFEPLFAQVQEPIITELDVTTKMPEINESTTVEEDLQTDNAADTVDNDDGGGTTQSFLRLPVTQRVEYVIPTNEDGTEIPPQVTDLKPLLNMDIIQPTEHITMSEFQTQAATVASTLVGGTNSHGGLETKSELDYLMSDVIQQITDDTSYDSTHEDTSNRLTNFAHFNTSFLKSPQHSSPIQSTSLDEIKSAGTENSVNVVAEVTTNIPPMDGVMNELEEEGQEKVTTLKPHFPENIADETTIRSTLENETSEKSIETAEVISETEPNSTEAIPLSPISNSSDEKKQDHSDEIAASETNILTQESQVIETSSDIESSTKMSSVETTEEVQHADEMEPLTAQDSITNSAQLQPQYTGIFGLGDIKLKTSAESVQHSQSGEQSTTEHITSSTLKVDDGIKETAEDSYVMLGEFTQKPKQTEKPATSAEVSTTIASAEAAPSGDHKEYPELIINTTETTVTFTTEQADEEDDEDQYHEPSTSTSTSSTTTSTTPKPTQTTTKRLNTLKPVSYFKQPSFGNNQNNLAEPSKMNTIQQRPMQRPPALNNLMATSTQATRPPLKLEPSPIYSMGLEASTVGLEEDWLQFSRLCNELAFSYWKSITSEKISSARSLVLSPFALTSMLSMIFLGARGSTSGEMNEVLKLDDMVTFNPHFVFKNVTESVEKATDSDIATTAFVREIFSDRANGKILQFFKQRSQQFYAGHIEEVNFNVVNDVIRRRTNLLVKRHTMGKVLEYLRTNSVWVNGPLATISANLFQTDCRRGSTNDRDGEMFFQVHPSVRQRRLVPIPAVLYKSGFTIGYEPKLDATIVAFGDVHDTVSTIYIMPGHQSTISPTDNLDRFEKEFVEKSFKENAWSNILTSLMDRPGMEVQLPRFSHRSFVNASLGLQKMGLEGLFKSDHADLGGLTGSHNRDIYISDMIQINTFSTCGEEKISDHHHVEMYPAPPLRKRNKDVESADPDDDADTYDSSEAIIDFGSLVQDPVMGRGFYDDLLDPKYLEMPLSLRPRQARVPDAPRLRFDKPFLYFVRHNPTGMILFMGRFNPRLLP